MVDVCLAPLRRGLDTAGVDSSLGDIFAFFVRWAGEDCVAIGLEGGLGSRAFRLRTVGGEWELVAAKFEAELDEVAAADEGSAASFVAERVTLGDMRFWV